MITVTIQATDWDDFKSQILGIVDKVKKAAPAKQATAPAPAAAEQVSAPEPEDKETPPVAEAPVPVTLEAVRAYLSSLGSDKMPKVQQLIKDLGATALSKLPAEKLPELMAKAKELA
jgi:hypothetical protein